jgi:hypothetical protein
LLKVVMSEARWPHPARQTYILEVMEEKVDTGRKDHPTWSARSKDRQSERRVRAVSATRGRRPSPRGGIIQPRPDGSPLRYRAENASVGRGLHRSLVREISPNPEQVRD